MGELVIYPLGAFSLLAVTLILERLLFWWRIQGRSERVIRKFFQLYPQQATAALQVLEKNEKLPIARIFLAALALAHPTSEKLRLALETASQAELPLLRRFSTVLETIISASPLLGLLGTILGLMEAFDALNIGDPNATNARNVSEGISDALISTALGLVVAISTLLFANLFRGLYRRHLAFIQKSGGQLELLYSNQTKVQEPSISLDKQDEV